MFLLLITAVWAQTQICQSSDFIGTYNKGDSIVVCLFFQTTTNSLYRQVYQLTVDQYTALLVSGAYTTIGTTESSLFANSGSLSTSYGTLYTQSNGAYPIQSIVIQMIQGVIIDVFWDNVCFDGGECQENTITTTSGSTIQENNDLVTSCTSVTCDPKVYVSFLGTDGNGEYFQSSSLRMSKFRIYSASQIYTNAQNTFNDVIDEYSKYTVSTN